MSGRASSLLVRAEFSRAIGVQSADVRQMACPCYASKVSCTGLAGPGRQGTGARRGYKVSGDMVYKTLIGRVEACGRPLSSRDFANIVFRNVLLLQYKSLIISPNQVAAKEF